MALLAWDFSGLDLWMAQQFGSAQGFALSENWFWRGLLHDKIRPWPWVLELMLVVAIFWPLGSFKRLPKSRRVQLALTTLAAALTVSLIKAFSRTSCPWDLQQFGGVATYVSHWAWGVLDGGTGRCFPAGHASTGFAFLGGFFAFRHVHANAAWRWFFGAMLAGFIFGLTQQIRGAHFMSHTLWTAWLCWVVALVIDCAVSWLSRSAAPISTPISTPAD
ncbi:hypothetical protein AwPolaro_04780 [Polaromonas sp.]|nr:hypothetical protein AwPolaro_04780 [Polaromonas sp.]